MPPLTKEDIEQILHEWFKISERTLQSSQMSLLLSMCETCSVPLYTKIAFDEACRWKSYQPLEELQVTNYVQQTVMKCMLRF